MGISAVIALIAFIFKSRKGRGSSGYDSNFDEPVEDDTEGFEEADEIAEMEEE